MRANDKDDIEMIPWKVHTSPGICLTAEETPRKPLLGDHLMKAVQLVIDSNGVPYFQTRSVGSHSISDREKEGKDGYLENYFYEVP